MVEAFVIRHGGLGGRTAIEMVGSVNVLGIDGVRPLQRARSATGGARHHCVALTRPEQRIRAAVSGTPAVGDHRATVSVVVAMSFGVIADPKLPVRYVVSCEEWSQASCI